MPNLFNIPPSMATSGNQETNFIENAYKDGDNKDEWAFPQHFEETGSKSVPLMGKVLQPF